ncbi:MmcQ/YjbR family DNA-binding protein [Ciceribacter sp. RN22]|uniref:MmcQ/YjbR family DNA-binding protein n=1 Tax=Ciceribacter sp. RN22 TaxID=2954932 RepID=UPI002092A048|nr:MmcQ/YjbR family DNA-binding protein [Ciceribacter sp. RN22]MCO6177569.1 MmcQ/YjbR family DNA-binding protein [Ciceribacter sp. RN22]
MTEDEVAALALSLPEAEESAHFGKRDFRLRDKVFATLPRPDELVLKLTPDRQALAVAAAPGLLSPVPGAWGMKGWTVLHYASAEPADVADLLRRAWETVAPKGLRG